MATTLTSKGQVTIPKHIREALDLGPGVVVDFAVNDDGDVEFGARAAVSDYPILMRDVRRDRNDFSTVRLIAPPQARRVFARVRVRNGGRGANGCAMRRSR